MMQRAQAVGVLIVPIGITVRKRRLMFLLHILRQGENSMLNQVFCSEFSGGKRRRGGPTQSIRHSILDDLKSFNLPQGRSELLVLASNINKWKELVELGSLHCLKDWLAERAAVKAKSDARLDVKMAPLVAAIADGHVASSRRSYTSAELTLKEVDLELEYFNLISYTA